MIWNSAFFWAGLGFYTIAIMLGSMAWFIQIKVKRLKDKISELEGTLDRPHNRYKARTIQKIKGLEMAIEILENPPNS